MHLLHRSGRLLAHARSAAAAAALLLCCAAAQAALVVTSAVHTLAADTSRSAEQAFTTNITAGTVNESVRSPSLGQSGTSSAEASLDTAIGPTGFTGTGRSSLALADNSSGEAQATWQLLFTLTSNAAYTGQFQSAFGGNAPSTISFLLQQLTASGDVDLLSADESVPVLALSGTLTAGDYRLRLSTLTDSIDPNEDGVGRFDLAFNLRDLRAPGAVPEPHSLALVLAGLLAAGMARRRRTQPGPLASAVP